MHRFFLFLTALILLGGCQTARLSELDYSTRHDFSRWQYWQWADPAIEFLDETRYSDLDADRIRQIVGEQLLQWGYLSSDQPDFKVRARLSRQEHTERVLVHQPGFWNDPWGLYGPRSGWLDTEEIRYTLHGLQLDILDAASGKLVWRATSQWPARHQEATRPAQRDVALRKAASTLLKQFPPR